MNRPPPKPCTVCDKLLECAVQSWDTYQPYGGGEIQLIFGYGSCELDNHGFRSTIFRGIICDECALKMTRRIDEQE